MKRCGVFLAASILVLSIITSAEVYLKEPFSDADWEKRWIQSQHRDDLGKFTVSPGNFYADEIESRGLKTTQDARFYAISTKFNKTFNNIDKDFIVQFSVKHEQNIDCGGGYVKLLPPDFDALNFKGESPYNIMFGPDICGANRKVHFILNYNNENKPVKKQINAPSDQLTHLFTLILKPDHTYTILIDNKEEASGQLEEDFDLLPPKEIPDPDAKKPEDWVDESQIPDPNDKKPDDWIDVPRTIPNPEAEKPDDWDDDSDGEWEPPHMSNPEFKGEWRQKMIDNPNYKGPWKVPLIPNPVYKEDKLLHVYNTLYIGFDLWQVKSGTIFDNILITDDIEEANKLSNETFVKYRDAELEAKRKLDDLETGKTNSDEKIDKDDDLEDDDNENDEIIDLDVEIDSDGQVKVTKPDDLPPTQEDKQIPIQEKSSTNSATTSTVSESSPSPTFSTKDENDELDKSFNKFEEEIGIPIRDEL
ncbi:Calreticulin family-domain-containing protein [Glomus cerebriforme]|uniref:Calreticulin family-domain-containing protein n=1 Tax=Glomus cerebriforme TaxID=658196 RepID=A0A397TIQ1_9GLOM|nr:Calreticulin family-domain-containing protein [Glomus cerebriforme]